MRMYTGRSLATATQKYRGGGGAYSQRIEMEAKWVPNIIALSASNSPKPYGSALSHYKLTLMHLPILDMLMQKTAGDGVHGVLLDKFVPYAFKCLCAICEHARAWTYVSGDSTCC